MCCFKPSHDRGISTLIYVKPCWTKFRAKLFQVVCQYYYLSSWVSILIKMNGHLMTGAVSFNVTIVFIYKPNITLCADYTVYEPSLQSSRVTAITHPYSSSHFLCLSLYLPVFFSSPFFPTISALLCFYHQRHRRYLTRFRLCYLEVIFYSPTVAFGSCEHTVGNISYQLRHEAL